MRFFAGLCLFKEVIGEDINIDEVLRKPAYLKTVTKEKCSK
jgi:hypothetical protein